MPGDEENQAKRMLQIPQKCANLFPALGREKVLANRPLPIKRLMCLAHLESAARLGDAHCTGLYS